MLKRSLIIAAAISMSAAAAQADTWKRFGSVRFHDEVDRKVESGRFSGPIDKLRLTARGSGVICRKVVAVFGNNKRREIFSGRIRRNRYRMVDLPGGVRRVERLVLVCRATKRGRDSARILIAARTEQRRADTHRGTRFAWERLGSVVLDRRLDREVETVQEFGAMDRLRFTPRRSGVVCRRIVAVFGNGNRRTVFSGRIRRNQRRYVDLPGRRRHINRLVLNCRATARGYRRARLIIDGRMAQRHRRRGRAAVCCRKLFFEWTTTARQCYEIDGRVLPLRACR